MKILAKTMAFLLLLGTGSQSMLSQNILLINKITPLLAYSPDLQNDIELSTAFSSSMDEYFAEDNIPLENWMIEQGNWKTGYLSNFASDMALESETELITESWMIRPFLITGPQTWDFLEEVKEEPLEVRKWMICCTDWNIKIMRINPAKIPTILQ